MNSNTGKLVGAAAVVAAILAALFFSTKEPAEEAVVAEVVADVVETPQEVAVVEPEAVTPEPEVVEETAVEPESEPEVVEENPAEPETVEEVSEPEVVEEIIEPEVVEEVAEVAVVEEAVEEVAEVAVVEEIIEVVVEEPTAPAEAPATPEETAPEADVEEATEQLAEVMEAVAPETPDVQIELEGEKPAFDVVRVDNSGTALIAGTAEPNTTVNILSNGEKVGEAVAGNSGEFVAIIQALVAENAQTLELRSELDGQMVFSDASILILPTMDSAAAEEVASEEPPVIIRATKDEVIVLQSAAQLYLDQISLDSVSYDAEGEIVLAGRGNPGNSVIVYVDGMPIQKATISESGSWITTLQGLSAGRYMLRVDEVDANGKVNSRAELPFQRAFPEEVRQAQEAVERGQPTYIVQPGNSLWVIATQRYGEGVKYYQIFTANRDQIRDPDLIYPGQVFALPED